MAKGLYLQVMPNGSRYWRMKYRFDGKEKLASFAVYPEVSLADARKACLAARQLLAAGTDPSEQKKEVKRARALEAVSSFEAVARAWFESQKADWPQRSCANSATAVTSSIASSRTLSEIRSRRPTSARNICRSVAR
jgi:hypothetical protein